MSGDGIYLAGPVEQTDDPHTWRGIVKRRFPDIEFIDPMDFQRDWDDDPEGVVSTELAICESHPILVCNIGSGGPRTVGTHHEIAHALAHGNDRVAAVCKGEPAGFIKHRPVMLFDSIEEAVEALVAAPVADGGLTEVADNGTEAGE